MDEMGSTGEQAARPEKYRSHFLGAPQFFNLNQACAPIGDAYGNMVFLVGSSLRTRDYRDVDVRCLVEDAEFDRLFPGMAGWGNEWTDARWSLLCSAISSWLSERTGLPIDFQFQRQTQANEQYPTREHRRNGLGFFIRPDTGGGAA